MLRAPVVTRPRQERARQPPEPRPEPVPFLARQGAVALAEVPFEERRQVAPLAALRCGHEGEGGVDRAVRGRVLARRMQREPAQRPAPPPRGAARFRRVHCVVGPAALHEIAHALPRDPGVAGEERCEAVELVEQRVARAADPLRLGRWLLAVVAVPVAEAADQLVAAAPGPGSGEVPPAGQLELPLRPARGPKQGLGVAWQEERRGGRRRLREQGGHEGEERVHGNASGMYTPGGRACVPRRGDAFSPSPPFSRLVPCPLVRCRSASRSSVSCLAARRAARPPRPPPTTRPCSPASSGGRSGSFGAGARSRWPARPPAPTNSGWGPPGGAASRRRMAATPGCR